VSDGRYSPEAFYFLFEALDVAVQLAGKAGLQGPARHVTGQEVLKGLRAHALTQFGPLASNVWKSWGVRESMDWGRIVFLLVEREMLKRQEDDSIEEFRQGFDFERSFASDYRERLSELLAARESKESS
jgi:uncharacterized repeat protein (TIGR04138 family)